MRLSPKGRRFGSAAEIERDVQQRVEEIEEKVVREVADEVRDKMVELIGSQYASTGGENYRGTGQLMDAVRNTKSKVYKTPNGWRVHIKLIDTDLITNSFADVDGMFNSYTDLSGHATYGGKRYTQWVVEWVDQGSPNGRIYGHTPIHFSDEINDMLDKKVQDKILVEMRRAGFVRK